MQHANICILGGTGFIGRHIASRLIAQGKQVRIPTRNLERHRDLLVLPGIELVEADIYDSGSLHHLMDGTDCVINLVGILNEKQHNGDGFRRVHVELPRLIMNENLTAGVTRILHMSALNADANKGRSHYLRSKGEGEITVHSFSTEKLHVTSFRPSVIFGPGDSFFNRFAGLLKMTPFVFPLACPNARFAPVYVGDVASRFIQAMDDKKTFGQRYDLCGPRQYSLIELVRYTAAQLRLRRRIIGLPDKISYLQAAMLEWFPGKPFSLDNYKSLQTDSICNQDVTETTSIESIVPYYIGNKGRPKNYDRYRSQTRK
jgi:NADH dehydrogenase